MSTNFVNKSTGELVTLANGTRCWIGTKSAHDNAVQQGTMPNNCMVCITDDAAGEEAWEYSTSETRTGKTWIDGKPIYRKVMQPTAQLSVTASDWVTINSVISLPSNIDQLLFAEIRHANNYSPWIAMARYVSGNLQVYSPHGIELYTGGTIIIEYTKTTD